MYDLHVFRNYSQFVSWLVLFLFLLVVVNSLRFVKVLLKFY